MKAPCHSLSDFLTVSRHSVSLSLLQSQPTPWRYGCIPMSS